MITHTSCHEATTIPLQEAVLVLLCQGLVSALQMAESEHQGRDTVSQSKVSSVQSFQQLLHLDRQVVCVLSPCIMQAKCACSQGDTPFCRTYSNNFMDVAERRASLAHRRSSTFNKRGSLVCACLRQEVGQCKGSFGKLDAFWQSDCTLLCWSFCLGFF